MWNPFRRRRLLSDEDEHFQIECFRWLLRHFGGSDFHDDARLVLPTAADFPIERGSDESVARQYFDRVRELAGMDEWEAELVAHETDPQIHLGELLIVQDVEPAPLGRFSADTSDQVTISYNPALLRDPALLVSTFAHELAHYLTANAPEPPPGGWDNWEFATDITASFMGFGVFMANTAFRFRQYGGAGVAGWQTSGGGYLSQAEHSFALALFLRLKDIPASAALPHCDPNVRGFLKRALADLDDSDAIASLRQVVPVD
ncbi:MAG: hypothetical protein KDI51_08475 [Xanthomonadales bacterium]|nr:hypothetical protein [Xanthomonadales bacterium]